MDDTTKSLKSKSKAELLQLLAAATDRADRAELALADRGIDPESIAAEPSRASSGDDSAAELADVRAELDVVRRELAAFRAMAAQPGGAGDWTTQALAVRNRLVDGVAPVSVVIPLAAINHRPTAYLPTHIDISRLTPAQATAARRLFFGLDLCGMFGRAKPMPQGDREAGPWRGAESARRAGHAEALRWLLDAIAIAGQ